MGPTSYDAFPHIPGILDHNKFVTAAKLFGYRMIHEPYDPCPEGPQGCALCQDAEERVGYHRREPQLETVTVAMVYQHAGGVEERLHHRFLTTPAVLVAPVAGVETVLSEGVDYRLDGRKVVWLAGRRPDYQSTYTATYTAVAEAWVHLQHAYGDFGGLKRQAEKDRFLPVGYLPQGSLLMSINNQNPGYDLLSGDVFVPADSSVKRVRHIVAGRAANKSMHRYVHDVVAASWVDASGATPVERAVQVTYDRATRRFTIQDSLPDDTKVAVIYRCAPQYFVYLDGGEFRHPMGEDHQRLVVLSQLETTA